LAEVTQPWAPTPTANFFLLKLLLETRLYYKFLELFIGHLVFWFKSYGKKIKIWQMISHIFGGFEQLSSSIGLQVVMQEKWCEVQIYRTPALNVSIFSSFIEVACV